MDTAEENGSADTEASVDESLQAVMTAPSPAASHRLPPAISDLRLVVLGRKGVGKSAAGNTILGGVGGFESGKPTEECVKRRADVAGRKVTVVDTPGWEWYYPLNSTPNWVRRETLRSVSLCPPGPHAVLLVVRACASVTRTYIQEIEEHLDPLGKDVWEHSMLLFTRGDELGLSSMEQRILSSGPGLQTLIQKCGNRYHVLNNRNKGDETQVKELIRKVEQMVEGKRDGGNYLEMDNVVLGLEADAKRRARERRKKQRQMETQMQRGIIKAALMNDCPQGSELDAHQSFSKAARRLPEVRLVLLGERETGKSSAGNTILSKMDFFQAGAVTEECTRQQAEVATRLVTVVDTPGWEAGVAGATPERVRREIAASVSMCPPGPHALLLTLRVDTLVRVGHVREHLELLGDGVWRHTILLFTHGDQLREGVDIEQHIQGGGRDLQLLLEKCRGRCHVFCNVDVKRQHGGSTQVIELLDKVEKMASRNRCEAFSSLVQEVLILSQQRNEKFNQRLKDMGDKALRQEVELKNMRDREMKSIRWFFDRKKKVKSPGKADVQREEEEDEDKRISERKNDFGELEERMRWLTEEKERELQDLSVENNRIHVALKQSKRERDEAMLSLELKDREIEELKERNEEQQLKLLDLECACVENEHETKQREEAIRAEKLRWREEFEKLKQTMELLKKEKAEWMENTESLKAKIEKTKKDFEDLLQRKEKEKDQEMAEMEQKLKKEMEIKLLEKDKEQQELRREAAEEKLQTLATVKQYEKDTERKIEEMKSQHKKEIERKIQEKNTEIQDMKWQHQEEMKRKISDTEKRMETIKVEQQERLDQVLKEKADEIECVKKQHVTEIRKIQEEKEKEISTLKKEMEAEQRKIAALEKKYLTKIQESVLKNEKDKETANLKYKGEITVKMQEKEKEMAALRLQQQEELAKVAQMEKLMEARRVEHHEEIDRKVKLHEEHLEKVQQQYTENIRSIEQERHRMIEEMKESFAEEMEKQKQKHVAQMRELRLEQDKEKEMINGKNERYILETLQQRDRLTEELKRQMQEHLRESEKENESYKRVMEQRVAQKEKEIGDMKVNVKELNKMLQEKDERQQELLKYGKEVDQRLKEKEKDIEEIKLNVEEMKTKLHHKEEKEEYNLSYIKKMEQTLEEKEQEQEEMRKQLKQLEQSLRQAETEREKDRLHHKRQMQQKLEEKEQALQKLQQHVKDINEILQRKEEERGEIILSQKKEAEQRLQDREREMEETRRQLLNEMERRVTEKEAEIESMKQQVDSREARWREEQRKKEEEGESETNRLIEAVDRKTKEIAQAQMEIEAVKKTCQKYLQDIEELKEINQKQASSVMALQQRHTEQDRRKDAAMMGKLQEKQEEIDRLRERDRENENELVQLRLTIEQTKSELKELTSKMEKEMTNMIQEYEGEIAKRNRDLESVAKQKDDALSRLEEERRQSASDVAEKDKESQRRVEDLKVKYEELRKDSEDVRKHLTRYEEEVESRESEIQRILEEKDLEVVAIKEANDKLRVELGRIREREDEAERTMAELREHYDKQLLEKQSEFSIENKEFQEKILKFEQEIGQREEDLQRNIEDLSKHKLKLQAKEEELLVKEGKVESKEEELRELEASLKIRQEQQEKCEQELKIKAQNMEEKERDLENLLQALEGQQQLLSSHGQDLQKKVKGLKDHGKELKNRECYLKTEEQELLNFKSQLQQRNEHTAQQLDELGRDLALLKRDLHTKENDLKHVIEKLSKWEKSLEAREADLRKAEHTDVGHAADSNTRVHESNSLRPEAVVESSEDVFHLMSQEVSERRERDGGKESDNREKDRTTKTALSAAETNNCHLETLQEIEVVEEGEGTRGRRVQMGKKQASRDVDKKQSVTDGRLLSQGHRNLINRVSPGSDLTVVVLGESWSSRAPAGVTILGGEASKPDGCTFRSWRGHTAGRRLAVGEPLGLRWRDGPDPANTAQRESILDCVSWCRPAPHVVLLLIPAFLTCTQKYRRAVEQHMSLLGEGIWQRTLVLFTWGETLGVSAEQHILRNGELTGLVGRCRGGYHVLSSKNSSTDGLFEKMEEMLGLDS